MNENEFSRKKILLGLFWVYCETMAAQLMSLIINIILARLLEPEHYGVIALVSVFINIANVFVTSSFSLALVQNKDADMLDYNSMFWFNLVLSLLLYVILFSSAPFISSYYKNINLTLVIRILAIRIPISAYNSIQLAYISNHMTFKKSFFANTVSAIIGAIIGITMAYMGFNIWALIAQSLSNLIISTIIMQCSVDWKPRIQFSFIRIRKMIGYGGKILFSGLITVGYSELRSLVIGKKYSAKDLAYYDKGYTFPRFIASNIDSTITRVLFPALSQNQDEGSKIYNITRRSVKTSIYIMTPILFGLAIIAVPLVKALLTEKWLPCVPYLQIMCIVWWLQPIQSCSIQMFKAIGRSDIYLYIEIVNKMFGIVCLFGAVYLFNSALAIAASMMLGQVISALIYGLLVSKYIGYKILQQLYDLWIPCAISICMCICVWLLREVIPENIGGLMIRVLVGIVSYIFLSVFFHVEEFSYLLKILKRHRL